MHAALADDEVAHALEAVALIAERRDHMAGKLSKALLTHCLEKGWLRRYAGQRALEVTPRGRKQLAGLLPSANGL